MKIETHLTQGRRCYDYKDPNPEFLLVQPVDEHDRDLLEHEIDEIRRLTQHPFHLIAFLITDWNWELSPWDAPAVFGNEGFGHGAEDTLRFLESNLLQETEKSPLTESEGIETYKEKARSQSIPVILGGYSLAGLFALWAAYQTDLFSATAAASPSVWFPGWIDYVEKHQIHSAGVYLSLGRREERTKNPVMARVGDNIRSESQQYKKELGEMHTVLEWNNGNHFRDTDLRTAQAFAWCMQLLSDLKNHRVKSAEKYIRRTAGSPGSGNPPVPYF